MKKLFEFIHTKDLRIFIYFNQKIRCRILDCLMPRLTHLGGATCTIMLCLLLYAFGQRETKLAATEALITVTGSQSIVQLFKRTIYRKRPYMALPDVNTFWKKLLRDYSFPSGHTTAGFSLAAIFSLYFPSYTFIAYPLATMVGVSRIYTGMHYPTDVFIGAVIGVAFAIVTHLTKGMFLL